MRQQDGDDLPLFIREFFNVKMYHNTSPSSAENSLGRVINALTSAVNDKCATLPKYLMVIMDFDLLLNITDVFDPAAQKVVPRITDWVIRQINLVVRRKRIDLLDRKPGALSGVQTSIVFVRMLRRIGSFQPGSKMEGVCSLLAKFNDSLNDAVAKIGQHIMTITSCASYEHFNDKGLLSPTGKTHFWQEVDDLIERFNIRKMKLLPNLKNQTKVPHFRNDAKKNSKHNNAAKNQIQHKNSYYDNGRPTDFQFNRY